MKISGIKALGWVTSIAGLLAFIIAAAMGPIVPLGIVGWSVFILGLVILVPIYRWQRLRTKGVDEKVPSGPFRWFRHETAAPVGWILVGTGLVLYLASSLSGLPTLFSFAGWIAFMIGLFVLIVLAWRSLSGF